MVKWCRENLGKKSKRQRTPRADSGEVKTVFGDFPNTTYRNTVLESVDRIEYILKSF